MFLSIIIPAYNESNRINKTLNELIGYFDKKKYKWEIIVVDDGSIDKTRNEVSKIVKSDNRVKLIISKKNFGKGDAVAKGMLEANGEWRFLCDADLSMPIGNIERFISYTNKYDLIIGSREAIGSNRYDEPFYRHLYGKLFNIFVKILIFSEIQDTQCGFKLFRGTVAENIFSKQLIRGFAFDVESIFIAKELNYSICETGIEWHHSQGSKVTLSKGIGAFIEVINIKINHLRGKYNLNKNDYT